MSKTRNLANSAPQFNALIVPVGSTAQRPSATPGYIRFNTDLGTLESANSTAWANVGSGNASTVGGGFGTVQSVQNTNFIAVSGSVYAVNTATGNVTVTLPANPVPGNYITFIDYGFSFGSNSFIIYPNGSNVRGGNANSVLTTSGTSLSLIYIDSRQGWMQTGGVLNPYVGTYQINYLVVAGGGGSGELGGGGGAGGMVSGTATVTPGSTYTVTVGSGGAGSTTSMTAGGNSSISGSVASAVGGGYGAYYAITGGNGGSGGGGSRSVGTAGSGTAGQGNPGGFGASGGVGQTGGGGGAGASGTAHSGSQNGPGGVGATSSISGSSVYYAGGGGGGGDGTYTRGVGGTGGGANGLSQNTGTAPSGTSNTGGGGGGGAAAGGSGGSGGSGIVIISYIGTTQKAYGGTVTSYTSAPYTYWVHTFTSSGNFIA